LEQINGQLVMDDVETMDKVIADSLAARTFSRILLGVFAALALVMSCVGIYGVVSYAAAQRTHEIGIRMALGAEWRDVLRMVLSEGAKMAFLGSSSAFWPRWESHVSWPAYSSESAHAIR
jgi:putative ABC transport system permease protein